MLSLGVRVHLGAITIKVYSAFPKGPSIIGASPSDCLVSYRRHSLVESYPLCSPSRQGHVYLNQRWFIELSVSFLEIFFDLRSTSPSKTSDSEQQHCTFLALLRTMRTSFSFYINFLISEPAPVVMSARLPQWDITLYRSFCPNDFDILHILLTYFS